MWVALVLMSIAFHTTGAYTEDFDIIPQINNLELCVSHIIKEYFSNYSTLTYVDLVNNNEDFIKIVHSLTVTPVLVKTNRLSKSYLGESYLIVADNVASFYKIMLFLVKEPSWNPNGRFLIIISDINGSNINKMFDTLLKYHIVDVLIVTDYVSPELFTYNPFENYGCGRRYDRIIKYGKCGVETNNLYPKKILTGLENCVMQIVSPQWPPYTIDPLKSNQSQIGIEEYILREISILEKFSINITFTNDAETFTMINKDMSAVGPLYLLQEGKADIIIGGMILTHPRAKAFNYIYGHLSFVEDLRFQVRKSSTVPSWKNMYLEFDAIVWSLFILTFVTFFIIFIILVKPKDKGQIILKMFAYLFLNGRRIGGNCFTKFLFIIWVWFAYLINTYYQSSLVSLITNPSFNYQISNENDLANYNLKPCVSSGIRNYLLSVENISLGKIDRKGCETMLESVKTVSKCNDIYTVVLHSVYKYNEHKFFDDWGDPLVYTFNQPLSKVVYTIYLYKGFPMLERLRLRALKLRENGLIEHYIQKMHWHNNRNYHFFEKTRKLHIIVPWYILAGGYGLSTAVFFLEILIKKHYSKMPNLLVKCHT